MQVYIGYSALEKDFSGSHGKDTLNRSVISNPSTPPLRVNSLGDLDQTTSLPNSTLI